MRKMKILFQKLNKRFLFSVCLSALFLSSFGQIEPFDRENVYEIEVSQSGVHKLTGSWLAENTNLDISAINPAFIQLWSGSPMRQIAIEVTGADDGRFDPTDAILFYGQSGTTLLPDYHLSPFDEYNYYYLSIGTQEGKRIQSTVSNSIDQELVEQSEQYLIVEEDRYNLLEVSDRNSGSGQKWVGEEITNRMPYSIDIPEGMNGALSTISADLVVRSDRSEQIILSNDDTQGNDRIRAVELGDPEDNYGRETTLSITSDASSPTAVRLSSPSPNARVWLDKVKLTYLDNHSYRGGTQTYRISEPNRYRLWQITKTSITPSIWLLTTDRRWQKATTCVQNVKIEVQVGDHSSMVVFDAESSATLVPNTIKKIDGLDLSECYESELIVIYHSDFQSAAERLATFRNEHSKIAATAVHDEDIYRAYGSGQKSPEAIRSFAKDVWEKNPQFKYLLLVGDGSYDYRGINDYHDDENFIPTYETDESLEPILAFPTDDYMALLDEEHPEALRGDLDIAIGRLPVRTAAEANAVIDKIISYEQDEGIDHDWKSQILFSADDEDYNLHINDADEIARDIAEHYPMYNQLKVYYDAYPQVSTPGGNRYPDAEESLSESINDGVLVVNYLGHGGPKGWAQERVLKVEDIAAWTNFDRLPLIITATCSFTGFDDPNITSAGEAALLNPVGGAVALFSTVRSVYASQNFRLTQAVYDFLFERDADGRPLPIGEILRRAKNRNVSDHTNARKFLLIGDPSMRLRLPTASIRTDLINGQSTAAPLDTLASLDVISIEGSVIKSDGSIDQSYNGQIWINLYDKVNEVTTLRNDQNSRKTTYAARENILHRGLATATSGKFSYEMTIPLDISYDAGELRLSYSAYDAMQGDMSGYFDHIPVKGSSINADETGPAIEMYINDPSYQSGSVISQNSTLIVKLSDPSDINLSNSAIGHEIRLQINGPEQYDLVLNDLYTPTSGEKGGMIRYTLPASTEGSYTATVTAYDNANNPSSAQLAFQLAAHDGIATVQIAPNPWSLDHTAQISTKHGLPNGPTAYSLTLYDLSGKSVTRLSGTSISRNGESQIAINRETHPALQNVSMGLYFCTLDLTHVQTGEKNTSQMEKWLILK